MTLSDWLGRTRNVCSSWGYYPLPFCPHKYMCCTRTWASNIFGGKKTMFSYFSSVISVWKAKKRLMKWWKPTSNQEVLQGTGWEIKGVCHGCRGKLQNGEWAVLVRLEICMDPNLQTFSLSSPSLGKNWFTITFNRPLHDTRWLTSLRGQEILGRLCTELDWCDHTVWSMQLP